MGKKNFIEKYDPFGAQIQRDEQKLSALTEKAEDGARPETPKVPPVEAKKAAPEEPAPKRAAPQPSSYLEEADDDDTEAAPIARRPAPERPAERPAPTRRPVTEAVRPVERPPAREAPATQGDFDRTEVSPRLKVTQAAFQDLETALANFHRSTGSQIHYSIATRALWGLLIQAEAQVQEELRKHPLGRLPSTRDKLAYAEYEERVKQVFAQAFRKLPRTLFQPIASNEAGEG